MYDLMTLLLMLPCIPFIFLLPYFPLHFIQHGISSPYLSTHSSILLFFQRDQIIAKNLIPSSPPSLSFFILLILLLYSIISYRQVSKRAWA